MTTTITAAGFIAQDVGGYAIAAIGATAEAAVADGRDLSARYPLPGYCAR